MKLLRLLITTLIILLLNIGGFSQNTAVSDVAYTPNSSAVLDVYSTFKSMMVPCMRQAQQTAIVAPATGLLVYQTDATTGLYQLHEPIGTTVATDITLIN